MSFLRVDNTQLSTSRSMVPAQLACAAESDRCDALLAKQAMEHTAMLVSYANQLEQAAPGGKDAYEAFVKGYVWKAGRRLMGGEWR